MLATRRHACHPKPFTLSPPREAIPPTSMLAPSRESGFVPWRISEVAARVEQVWSLGAKQTSPTAGRRGKTAGLHAPPPFSFVDDHHTISTTCRLRRIKSALARRLVIASAVVMAMLKALRLAPKQRPRTQPAGRAAF